MIPSARALFPWHSGTEPPPAIVAIIVRLDRHRDSLALNVFVV